MGAGTGQGPDPARPVGLLREVGVDSRELPLPEPVLPLGFLFAPGAQRLVLAVLQSLPTLPFRRFGGGGSRPSNHRVLDAEVLK